jgi:hypothetical protein
MKRLGLALALASSTMVAACGGGGTTTTPSGTVAVTTPAPTGAPTAAPTAGATAAATAAPQQIIMSQPGASAIGQENDPTFGPVGGYTQMQFSQTLGFVPGAQIMIVNGQPGVPHTLNVLSQTAFPVTPTIGLTAAGGSTLGPGYATGAVNGASQIGPITLTAGLYFIGCGFHYVTNGMRTVLNVAAGATPGPQATPVPTVPIGTGQFGY